MKAIITGERRWVLVSGSTALGLGVTEDGLLVQTWFGPPLTRLEDYPPPERGRSFSMENALQHTHQDIPTGEAGAFDERALDGTTASGLRGFVLRFREARVGQDRLDLVLEDAAAGLEVGIVYQLLDTEGLIGRHLRLSAKGDAEIRIERVLSGSFYLPRGYAYALNHLDGRWGDEYRMRRDTLAHGVIARESRRIATSHGGVPYFAMERDERGLTAGEETGQVWFGTLEWSGNWKLLAERTRDGRAIVHLGLNDHDFALVLGADVFETPRLIFGHTDGGFGAMSRTLHDFVRDEQAPRPAYAPPIVYNSWYATYFEVDVASQSRLAEKAAALGVEMFVVDDGWFDKRRSDRAGLGDWWPDAEKFPDGLAPLADAVHGLGMGLGLWIEPEMVNPDSDLYRQHPDWVIHFPERERTLSRNQSMLNLARADVQDYLIEIFDRLLAESGVDFIKWDMNRNVSEPGWPGAPGEPRELWVRYVEGLYRVWTTLRARHPKVIWENCSGGGGRVDMAMMGITEQSWASDTTMPPARLEIQEGYTQLFPASTMAAWVTDEHMDDYGLDLRFHVAMAGALGIGGDLLAWDEERLARARDLIAHYKSVRHLVHAGDLYRLASPARHRVSAVSYVAKDKSEALVIIARTHRARIGWLDPVRLAGLLPDALYRDGNGTKLSGAAWMARGVVPTLRDFESEVLHLTRIA